MRVLVTGGRDFDDRVMLFATLDRLHTEYGFTLLVHGDAKGADRLAAEWATDRGVEALGCPVVWRRGGRAAGPIRNLVVAFPGGRGTVNMIETAKMTGILVVQAK